MDEIIESLQHIKSRVMIGDANVIDEINKLIDVLADIVIPVAGVQQSDFAAEEGARVSIGQVTINIYPPSASENPKTLP